MPAEDKLIRNGIRYTDQLFKTILRRIEPHVYDSETYDEFLEKTAPYTIENPMITLAADTHAVNSVLLSVADNRFSYEANRKFTKQAIQDTTSQLVVNVGEDVKTSVTIPKGDYSLDKIIIGRVFEEEKNENKIKTRENFLAYSEDILGPFNADQLNNEDGIVSINFNYNKNLTLMVKSFSSLSS